MSAEKLRAAAERLRQIIHALDPWDDEDSGYCTWGDAHRGDDGTAYIAAMHPGVGLAVADWLDDAAAWMDIPRTVNHDAKAIEIADLILGDRS